MTFELDPRFMDAVIWVCYAFVFLLFVLSLVAFLVVVVAATFNCTLGCVRWLNRTRLE